MITPVARVEHPGTEKINIAKTFGTLLKDQFAKDPHFYLFSPDETTSNRLATVYDTQSRAWSLPVKDFDLPSAPDGHIVELLSENTLFATLLGHLSNGEQAMMTSYEAFFSIILSQIFQQIKFYKQMDAVAWRKPWPAVNLLSTPCAGAKTTTASLTNLPPSSPPSSTSPVAKSTASSQSTTPQPSPPSTSCSPPKTL